MQQVDGLLNPKANHKLRTTAHPIETLHLDVSELNKDFGYEGVKHAVFANRCERPWVLIKSTPVHQE